VSNVVKVEKLERVVRITIDRPAVLNVLNLETLDDLIVAFEDVGADPEVRAVIITGSGERAFIAGADIKEMIKKTPDEARDFAKKGHLLCKTIEELREPVIAAINGVAMGGGCEIACSCDIRIAGDNARLGQTEVGLGISAGWGSTVRLARIVGQGVAREMIFTGKLLSP
jgi:enoyl-CoA hydratase